MSIERLKDVDMSSTWSWFGEIDEFTLGTHRGNFVDGNIVVKLINDEGDKIKVNLYIQDVEVLEIIEPPTEKQKLLKLLDDVYEFLDGIADGAQDTEDFDGAERTWAKTRDVVHEAWKIAMKNWPGSPTEHVKQKRDGRRRRRRGI